MSQIDSPRRPASQRRRSDLRFAGVVSVGMIATVLALAALVAPLLAWNGSPASNARERDQTIRLSEPSTHAPTPAALTADRAASQMAASAAGRLVATSPLRPATERRTAGLSPNPTRRVGVTEPSPRSTLPRGAGPLANASDDTDGDGLPDAWERRYGLDPKNAADATADSDGDGLDNLTEMKIRTTPNRMDSDHNGVKDGDEDSDGDGLRNSIELKTASNPWEADSNNDGTDRRPGRRRRRRRPEPRPSRRRGSTPARARRSRPSSRPRIRAPR